MTGYYCPSCQQHREGEPFLSPSGRKRCGFCVEKAIRNKTKAPAQKRNTSYLNPRKAGYFASL